MSTFSVPVFEQIRDRYLQAVANQDPKAAIGPDSDHFVRASGYAAVTEGVYAHQAWVFRQAYPDLADSDNMQKMARQRKITPRPAVAATGTVRFFGAAGTLMPIGQQATTAQGVVVVSTASGAVGVGGTVDLASAAAIAGAAGNLSANTAATVDSPPDGVTAAATILTMTGGADVEDDASLLMRLLLELSEIAQGGNEVDYKRWALSVPGVDRVHVFPTRRGAGTVDIIPLPATGMPDIVLLAAVQTKIDSLRPVGMLPNIGALAIAPTEVITAVTAALALAPGATLAVVEPLVEAAIARVFAALEPGDTLVRHRLITAILNVPGVTDVTLAAPAANVTSLVDATNLQMVTQGVTSIT